jgi:hypothetical protein
MPKQTRCVKLIEADNPEERKKEGYPPYYACGYMKRVYLRSPRKPDKPTQPYESIGWYCKDCGTFVTDKEYPKRYKEMIEVSRQIKNMRFMRCHK